MNEQFLTIPEIPWPRADWRWAIDAHSAVVRRLREKIRLLEKGDDDGEFRYTESYCWACLEDAPLKDGLVKARSGTKCNVGLCRGCYDKYNLPETQGKETT